jgi:hypothetical protein
MREIRQSGSEGGARSIPRPYPYFSFLPTGEKTLRIKMLVTLGVSPARQGSRGRTATAPLRPQTRRV